MRQLDITANNINMLGRAGGVPADWRAVELPCFGRRSSRDSRELFGGDSLQLACLLQRRLNLIFGDPCSWAKLKRFLELFAGLWQLSKRDVA